MKPLVAGLGLTAGALLIAGAGLHRTFGAGASADSGDAGAGESSPDAGAPIDAGRGDPGGAAGVIPGSVSATGSSSDDSARRSAWDARERELLERIDALVAELDTERELRAAREIEWLEFTRAISSLPVAGVPAAPDFLELDEEAEPDTGESMEAAEAAAELDAEALAAEAAVARAAELLVHLRALLIAEQVLALDVLEVGRVRDGATGPVVVRLLDDRGRPAGTLAAERLRLEVSRAGRVVTLIFEEGFESRGGVPVPFGAPSAPGSRRGGERRIDLPGVDPEPWIEAFGDLIAESADAAAANDGLWNLVRVRMRLDDLLRGDTTSGHWRVRAIGGVTGGVLRDVQLAQLDDGGRIVRRLFADRLTIERHARGVRLLLEQGVQERAGRRAPFLEGRYRIYLPRAEADEWAAAGVPGLSEPPPR